MCLRFTLYSIMSSASRDSFTSSFPIRILLCLFVVWLLWLRLECKWQELALPSRWKVWNFSPLGVMLTAGFSHTYGLYCVEVCSLYVYFVESLCHKLTLGFGRGVFCIHWDDCMVFILQFVNVFYRFDWLCMLKHFLHPLDESYLTMVYDLSF